MAGLLGKLRERLDEIVGDEPLVVLKAAGELEAIVASTGPLAAAYVTGDEIPMPRVAEALGMTEKAGPAPAWRTTSSCPAEPENRMRSTAPGQWLEGRRVSWRRRDGAIR
ncbi:hypothetical protein [Streptomyces sp. TLI_105]|uniref:hypothetical protein n=1 Tax=Streptomyces sp. TLI_105 TaxID=1881019 RepID=UPI000B891B8F|nr:hypothetical protein [Streptomyces sp. TLI_105]